MPLPALAIPLAISAISGIIKYRGRLDEILKDNKLTGPLPYLLPEGSCDSLRDDLHRNDVLRFFETTELVDQGENESRKGYQVGPELVKTLVLDEDFQKYKSWVKGDIPFGEIVFEYKTQVLFVILRN